MPQEKIGKIVTSSVYHRFLPLIAIDCFENELKLNIREKLQLGDANELRQKY